MVVGEHTSLKEENDEKKTTKTEIVGVFELFRFADRFDKILMVIGSLFAVINGCSLPASILVFGNTMGTLVKGGKLVNLLDDIPEFMRAFNLTRKGVIKEPEKLGIYCTELDDFYNTTDRCEGVELEKSLGDEVGPFIVIFAIFGAAVIVSGFIQVICWTIAAEHQGYRIRLEFFKSILRQDIGWFDVCNPAEMNSRLENDINKVQRGLGETASTIVQFVATFIAGYAVGFASGPKQSAVLMASSPLVILAGSIYSLVASTLTANEQQAYGHAGAIAEEVLGAIRTVVAFGGEEKEVERYCSHLGEAEKIGQKKGIYHGFSFGFLNCVSCAMYALGLWYGGRLVIHEDYEFSDVLIVFYSISMGTMSIGNLAPGIQNITDARGSAFNVFKIIDTKPKIINSSTKGRKPDYFNGNIRFRDVQFNYPSRPDIKVLNGFNLEVRPGQTVALVGSSGCGKSTTVQLLLRFYDPKKGQVLLDGMDVKDLNLKWLRQKIGLVSQEPVLFDTTIAENIRYGRDDVTMDQIVEATKNANAYDFISKLPDKFNTLVGERGAQLSGGQKQRIAIARALVRDPKILLLDEATSALDTESEAVVQDALDKARKGRTTLVIAHRLSTIRTADIIVGIENGVVKEKGTHEELMSIHGTYYTLVMNQTQKIEEQNDDTMEEVELKRFVRALSNDGHEDDKNSWQHNSNAGVTSEQNIESEQEPNIGISRLLQMNSSEWYYLVIGCLCSLIFGMCVPFTALVFSEFLSVFQGPDEDREDGIRKWAIAFVLLGVVSLISATLQSWMFSIAGEALTKRLRVASFKAMLRQEMSWFDQPENSTGALTTKLSHDTSSVQECLEQDAHMFESRAAMVHRLVYLASGTRLGTQFQYLTAIGGGLSFSMYFGWQLTLVVLCFFPIIGLGTASQQKVTGGGVGSSAKAAEDGGKVAVQAIQNMRTVASLSKEDYFLERYDDTLKISMGSYKRNAAIKSTVFSISQAVLYFSLCIIFYYGIYLVEENAMDTADIFRVFACIVFSGNFIGMVTALGPDLPKAKAATRGIFSLLDRKTEVDAQSSLGKVPKETFHSSISFRDARFCYRTRQDVKVLQGLEFSVDPGQTVALVGSSGCGKSTTISLMERFYDLDQGQVILDNKYEVQDVNVKWLRSQIGLVSQEPVLFDRSIADNIAYGDNSRQVQMAEVIRVARASNIHNFIDALPNGYDTVVGDKGTQLSGGQKQRIAIARALVRNPKILLLDEATSALDTESEKIVQEALDKARAGRTCITIAHRLSTIQDADKIVVMHQGRAVEQGTHSELMALKGYYHRLQTVHSGSNR